MSFLSYLAIAGIATLLTRFLPYLFFKNKADTPILLYLQKTMSLVIMLVLLIYSLQTLHISDTKGFFFAFVCLFLAFFFQILIKNSLFSIAIPTILYIFLLKIY